MSKSLNYVQHIFQGNLHYVSKHALYMDEKFSTPLVTGLRANIMQPSVLLRATHSLKVLIE